MRAPGKSYNQGSEHKWAEWQVAPVVCPGCGLRVTLKHAFFGSHAQGTFHDKCAPYPQRKEATMSDDQTEKTTTTTETTTPAPEPVPSPDETTTTTTTTETDKPNE